MENFKELDFIWEINQTISCNSTQNDIVDGIKTVFLNFLEATDLKIIHFIPQQNIIQDFTEGVEVVDEVVGYLTGELGLHAKSVGEGEAVLVYGHVLAAHEGEAEVAVALAVDDVGSANEGSLDVDTTCGVAVVVAGVIDKTRLELQYIAPLGLVLTDEICIAIELVEGVLPIIPLEVYVAGHDVVIAQASSPM